MSDHKIKFYPVGNGDTTLFMLKDNSRFLVDCKIRDSNKTDSDGNNIFDVKADLIDNLLKTANNYHLDLFILTHPDEDHCLGFDANFYTGDPSKYKDSNRDNDEIILDELWVTSCLFDNAVSKDAKSLKSEAERRRKLWERNDSEKSKAGNRIRIIGYKGDAKYDNIPNSVPGDTITLKDINNGDEKLFEFFIHAPFKDSLVKSQAIEDKNSSSIIFQARFRNNPLSSSWNSFVLMGGDADHYRWEQVLLKSKSNDNSDKLSWDIFLCPHHCSWSFFNNVPYENEENREPKNYSLEILDFRRSNGFVIAQSKKIKNEKPNPPHQAAKDEYIKKTIRNKFLNTAVHGGEKSPEPIVFKTNVAGFTKEGEDSEKSKNMAAASVIASKSVVSGNWSDGV